MFTGLIETTGIVNALEISNNSTSLKIISNIKWTDLKYGESIAINGVCLTLEEIANDNILTFHILNESIKRTNLGSLKKGDKVNLERALAIGDRLGGHFVSGHIDTTSEICDICKMEYDFIIKITTPKKLYPFLIEKGSIAIDGISLTLVEVNENFFSVHIIPTTLKDTTLEIKKTGELVNLEGDMIGKYIFHQSSLQNGQQSKTTMQDLVKAGW